MVVKVIRISSEQIEFEDKEKNIYVLTSNHDEDYCETHYLSFEDLTLADFENLLFDLDGDFFNRIEDYGIELIPLNGNSVRIPGYGYNNGYYSSNLSIILFGENYKKVFDITECQKINWE